MQHRSHPGGPHPPIASVTTELVQQYLDENKELILAILDNQNHGKLNECAAFQQKLQSNLMFLAAVADAQTQPSGMHTQPPTHQLPGVPFMTPPQSQKQMTPQPTPRNPGPYNMTPPEILAFQQAKLQQSQQGMHAQCGSSLLKDSTETFEPLNSSMPSRGYYSGGGGIPEGMQMTRGLNVTGNRMYPDMEAGMASGGSGGLSGEFCQAYSKPVNDGENEGSDGTRRMQ